MKRAERAARHAVPHLSVTDMCDLLSTPPRHLNRAFQAVHGCPPFRFFRMQRYDDVRRALMKGKNGATISQIARCFGFTEFGRFAVQYRELFGERPSATLAKASASCRPSRRRH